MNDIERWSIDRLSKSLVNNECRNFTTTTTSSRPSNVRARILVGLARAIRHVSGRRKRHVGLAKAR